MTTREPKQPWIHSAWFDLTFIVGPAFLITGLVVFLPSMFRMAESVPLWAWVLFVMFIDVGHVYSTLFRTYFDEKEFEQRRVLYLMVPLLCFVSGVILYAVGALVFWRVLAYLAVFHFVRQQYGFMMIYARRDYTTGGKFLWLDKVAIYMATLYPLIYWHVTPRTFHWFIEGDFFQISNAFIERIAFVLYLAVLFGYCLKELMLASRSHTVNVGKNLLLIGTALSWYIGIVHFNGDMAFTLTNVVTHGIPYIALVWIYSWRRASKREQETRWSKLGASVLQPRTIPIFLGVLLILAYCEEAVWDNFVWREHEALFGRWFGSLVLDETLLWLVPLLALPQMTHYVLDAFIWKVRQPEPGLKDLLGDYGIREGGYGLRATS